MEAPLPRYYIGRYDHGGLCEQSREYPTAKYHRSVLVGRHRYHRNTSHPRQPWPCHRISGLCHWPYYRPLAPSHQAPSALVAGTNPRGSRARRRLNSRLDASFDFQKLHAHHTFDAASLGLLDRGRFYFAFVLVVPTAVNVATQTKTASNYAHNKS
jgi:hypothetical protein